MARLHLLSYAAGGAALANAMPHLVSGLSGRAFQTPFATPRGKGLSFSTTNLLWGFANIAIAYVLMCRVGTLDLRDTGDVAALGTGAPLLGLMLAHCFERLHGGASPNRS